MVEKPFGRLVSDKSFLKRFSEHFGLSNIGHISRQDINQYVTEMAQAKVGIPARGKHVGTIRGFFERAQAIGLYPHGVPLPTEGHIALKKSDRQRISVRNGWLPFDSDDHRRIVEPTLYNALTKLHEFGCHCSRCLADVALKNFVS